MRGGDVSALRILDFRDVVCTPDEWRLDKGRMLAGEFNVLAGEGGSGKTTTLAGWMAELTRDQVKVLYLGERSPKAVKKRLIAARADFDYVKTLDLRDFSDVRDSIAAIEQAVEDGFQVVVLDPISHFLPIEADSHNDAKLRAVTRPLADLMARSGLTVLGLHHLNKNEGASAVHRMTGSAWFKDYPANVLALGVHPHNPEQRALVLLKTNADEGTLEGAILYERRMADLCIDGYQFSVARSVEVGRSALDRNDVFPRGGGRPAVARDDAAGFLRRVLPADVPNIEHMAAEEGHSWRTVERAADKLGVVKRPGGFQKAWRWSLPGEAA
jgi:hypothetical protein